MPLRSIVKVSHLSNLSDARYCAGMGAEMLGFQVLPGSDRYMTPAVFQDIRGWISGPRIVAELYGVSSQDEIENAIKTYAPEILELSFEEFERFERSVSLPCLVSVSDPLQIRHLKAATVSHVIVGEALDCNSLPHSPHPMLIKVSSTERVREHLAQGCVSGFVLEGPRDIRPGFTNYEKLGAILELLEED